MDKMREMAAQLEALETRQAVQKLALDAALQLLTAEQANDCAEELRAGVKRLWLGKETGGTRVTKLRPHIDEALASEFATLLQRLAPIPPFAHSTDHGGLEVRDWTPVPGE